MRRIFAILMLCASATLAAQPKTIPSNVRLHGGYNMRALATSLNFPTPIALSPDRMWVAEAGFLPSTVPVIKEIDPTSGVAKPILSGSEVSGLLAPLPDATFFKGWL